MISTKVFNRFMAKVQKPNDNGCWLWTACKNELGYGDFGVGGKNLKAHRVSYQLFVGEIPDGLFILHSCDTPSCVSPFHLRTGNNQDNVNDMISRRRGGTTKLNGDIVKFIRGNPHLTAKELSIQFNISMVSIYLMRHNKTWTNSHIPITKD